MTSPRHLWSGDWERDSASLEAELATRERLAVEQPLAEPPPGPSPERAAVGTDLAAAIRRFLRAVAAALGAFFAGLRRLNPRALLLAGLVAVLVVAIALAVNALSGGGSSRGSHGEASLRAADALFGVQLSTPPHRGVVIETVTPGGPAEAAGLDPGDTLTAINNRPVSDANAVAAAVKNLHTGDQTVLQVSRGSAIIQTLLTLTGHP